MPIAIGATPHRREQLCSSARVPRRWFACLLLSGLLFIAAVTNLSAGEPPKVETLPKARGGQEIVGSRMPLAPKFTRWLAAPNAPEKPAKPPRLTLYRWWTNGCPFCAKTLPAIETLRKTHADAGLRVVAVYHPKPPRDVADDQIRKFAQGLGYLGEIAVDADWSVLKETYLSKVGRGATSISLLVDADGVIRFVHPGTEYFPSDKPDEAEQNADYRLLEKAVATLLAKQ